MKLNFNFQLVDLAGNTLKDENGVELNCAQAAAQILTRSTDTGQDALTKWDWAQQLHKTGEIDLDKAGQAQFRNFFQGVTATWLIVRMRILEVLDKRENELKAE